MYINKKREESHIKDHDKLKALKINIFEKEIKRNRNKISELKKEYEELEQRELMIKSKNYKKNISEQIKTMKNSIQEIKRGNFLLVNDNKRFAKELNSFHITENDNKTEGERINKVLKMKVEENNILVEKLKICKNQIYEINEKYSDLQKEMNNYKQRLISKGIYFNSTKEHTYYLLSLKICKVENEIKIKKKKSEFQNHQINNFIFENQEKINNLNKNIQDYEDLISQQKEKIAEILNELSQNEDKSEKFSEDFDIKSEIRKIFNENSNVKERELAFAPLTLSPGKTLTKYENQDFYLTNCIYETNSSYKPNESHKNEEVIREIKTNIIENHEFLEKNSQENNNIEVVNSDKNSIFSFENKDSSQNHNKEKIKFYSDYELQISALTNEKTKKNKEMTIRKTFSHDFENEDECDKNHSKIAAEKISEILKQSPLIIENKELNLKENNILIMQKDEENDIENFSVQEKEKKNENSGDCQDYKNSENDENNNDNENILNFDDIKNNITNENIDQNININNENNINNHNDEINKKDFENPHETPKTLNKESINETPQTINENIQNTYENSKINNEKINDNNAPNNIFEFNEEENEFLGKEKDENIAKNSISNHNITETSQQILKKETPKASEIQNSSNINNEFTVDITKNQLVSTSNYLTNDENLVKETQEVPNFIEENNTQEKIETKSRRINMRKLKDKPQENDFFFDISKKPQDFPKSPNFNLFSQKKSLKAQPKIEAEKLIFNKNIEKPTVNHEQMLEIIELPTRNFKEMQKSLEKERISSENYEDPEFILFKDPEKFEKNEKNFADPMKYSKKFDKTLTEIEKTSLNLEDSSPKKMSRLRMGATNNCKKVIILKKKKLFSFIKQQEIFKDSPNYFTEFDF